VVVIGCEHPERVGLLAGSEADVESDPDLDGVTSDDDD
jgi:hypothetical protein